MYFKSIHVEPTYEPTYQSLILILYQSYIQFLYPIGSMYGIFTYIYHKFKPNVATYTSPTDPMGILSTQKTPCYVNFCQGNSATFFWNSSASESWRLEQTKPLGQHLQTWNLLVLHWGLSKKTLCVQKSTLAWWWTTIFACLFQCRFYGNIWLLYMEIYGYIYIW